MNTATIRTNDSTSPQSLHHGPYGSIITNRESGILCPSATLHPIPFTLRNPMNSDLLWYLDASMHPRLHLVDWIVLAIKINALDRGN